MMRREAAAAAAGIGKAKHAIVTAVDPDRGSVRVQIQPEQNESGWIPDPGLACGDLRISCPCEVGTQVLAEAVEGEAENWVIVSRLFDAVVLPGTSPQTNQPAQPGEILMMTGQGTAPQAGSQTAGKPTSPAAWWHLLTNGFCAGIGTTKFAVEDGKITLTLGSTTYTATASAFTAAGGSINTDQSMTADQTVTGKQDVNGGGEPVSLVTHVHSDAGGTGDSGPPV